MLYFSHDSIMVRIVPCLIKEHQTNIQCLLLFYYLSDLNSCVCVWVLSTAFSLKIIILITEETEPKKNIIETDKKTEKCRVEMSEYVGNKKKIMSTNKGTAFLVAQEACMYTNAETMFWLSEPSKRDNTRIKEIVHEIKRMHEKWTNAVTNVS